MGFSVLMAVYKNDSPAYLLKAIASALEQTLKPNQFVIVGDGPLPDEIIALIEDFSCRCSAIKFIPLAANVGLGAALNEGLKHCEYEFVARMDADDICLPERFERQLTKIHNEPDLDVVGCFATEIDNSGKKGVLRTMPVNHDDITENLWACPFIHPTVMFRRDKVVAVGGYNHSLRRRQDYELWFRCAKAGLRFSNVPEPLLLYRFDRNTHKKQPVKLALEQAMIGYRGASLVGMSVWKRLACFAPFFRSLLPAPIQHQVYYWLKRFDPRQSGR